MIQRFVNKTNQSQQINFIDGSAVNIPPKTPANKSIDIDTSNIYKEELERAKKFFIISPVPEEKDFTSKTNFTSNKVRRK